MALPSYAPPAASTKPSTAVDEVTQHQSLVHLTRTATDQGFASGGSGDYVVWDNEVTDTDDLHSMVANQTRITVKYAGKYEIVGKVQLTQNASGWRRLSFDVNGVQKAKIRVDGTANTETQMGLTASLDLAAGDYIEMRVGHNAGPTLFAVRDDDLPSIVVKRVV